MPRSYARGRYQRGRRGRASRRRRRYGYRVPTGRAAMARYYTPRTTSLSTAGVIPDVMYCKMRYNDQFSMSATVPNSAVYQFAINDIYDPNITGTGHQPRGHDQWANMYTHYEVQACAIRVRAVNMGDAAILLCVPQSYDSASANNHYNAGEIEEAKLIIMPEANGTGEQYGWLQHYIPCKKVGGHVTDDVVYQGALGSSSPSRRHKWTIVLGGLSITSGSASADIQVDLLYYVKLFDKKNIGTS